ncbi:MAG: hypothetical protein H7X80_03300 [bacterium]|nr:hypothetical protein [Candidatus Kapabacteria bacterium]
MPEITGILLDDVGTITHLETSENERLSVEDLAAHLDRGDDYYVTFDEGKRYSITIVAEDGRLEPTIDDPDGVHTIWDLDQMLDPEELEIDQMFEEMEEMGEYDAEEDGTKRNPNPEELL